MLTRTSDLRLPPSRRRRLLWRRASAQAGERGHPLGTTVLSTSEHGRQVIHAVTSVPLYTIIAWKILYLCRLGRECPDLNCEVVFSPSEWKAVYCILHRTKRLPEVPPTLNQMLRMIATLGGYVPRAKTHPGTQTLWIGSQRAHDMSSAWIAFGPDSASPD